MFSMAQVFAAVFMVTIFFTSMCDVSTARSNKTDFLRRYQANKRAKAAREAEARRPRYELYKVVTTPKEVKFMKMPPKKLIQRQIAEYTNPNWPPTTDHFKNKGYKGWKLIWRGKQWYCVTKDTPGFTPKESVYTDTRTGVVTSIKTGRVLYRPASYSEKDAKARAVRPVVKEIDPLLKYARANCNRVARECIDKAYSSTGEDPSTGFSALGLIKYVYTKLGYPPKANDVEELRKRFGTYLSAKLEDVVPGDLLYFRLYSKKKKKSTLMVAICADNSEMIYPSFTRKKVVVRDYNTDFWRKNYVGANRVFSH